MCSLMDVELMKQQETHFVIGYGSLMSDYSRRVFTGIDAVAIPVQVHDWQRRWMTNCDVENFTSVGAVPSVGSYLNGVLLPMPSLTEALQKREARYRFTQLQRSQLSFYAAQTPIAEQQPTNDMEKHTILASSSASFWICESLVIGDVSQNYPLLQSYIDTCLIGCLEHQGDISSCTFAKEFITSTLQWPKVAGKGYWLDDRAVPQYPRAAKLSRSDMQKIDDLLRSCNLLQYRSRAV